MGCRVEVVRVVGARVGGWPGGVRYLGWVVRAGRVGGWVRLPGAGQRVVRVGCGRRLGGLPGGGRVCWRPWWIGGLGGFAGVAGGVW